MKYLVGIITMVLGMCLTGQAATVVAYYNFNDSAGITNDNSGNGHNLEVAAGYATPTYTSGGKYGGGSAFDGSTQGWFISNYIYPAGSFSFAAWIKPAGTIAMISSPWSLSSGFNVYVGADKYRFQTIYGSGSTSNSYVISSASPTNGVWQHITMTYEATNGPVAGVYSGTIKGYVNGELVATLQGAQYASSTANDMGIGRRSTSAFNGVMDEVYIYSGALTQSDIQALMVPESAKVLSLRVFSSQ